MTENMQADVALSRKAVFVRGSLNFRLPFFSAKKQ